MIKRCLLLALLSSPVLAQDAMLFADLGLTELPSVESPQATVWHRDIIPIALPVGRLRMINFPETIADVSFPNHLTEQLTLNIDITESDPPTAVFTDTLPMTAHEPFEPADLVVTTVSGQMYQLTITAQEGVTNKPIRIAEPPRVAVSTPPTRAAAPTVSAPVNPATPRPRVDIELLRYATRRIEAPRRLFTEGQLETPPGARTVSVPQSPRRLILNHLAEVTPVIGFTNGHQTVTVLSVRNTGPITIDLATAQLRGEWLASHYVDVDRPLRPGQSVTLYVLSKSTFLQALGVNP